MVMMTSGVVVGGSVDSHGSMATVIQAPIGLNISRTGEITVGTHWRRWGRIQGGHHWHSAQRIQRVDCGDALAACRGLVKHEPVWSGRRRPVVEHWIHGGLLLRDIQVGRRRTKAARSSKRIGLLGGPRDFHILEEVCNVVNRTSYRTVTLERLKRCWRRTQLTQCQDQVDTLQGLGPGRLIRREDMATYTKRDSVELLNGRDGKISIEEFDHGPESVLG